MEAAYLAVTVSAMMQPDMHNQNIRPSRISFTLAEPNQKDSSLDSICTAQVFFISANHTHSEQFLPLTYCLFAGMAQDQIVMGRLPTIFLRPVST